MNDFCKKLVRDTADFRVRTTITSYHADCFISWKGEESKFRTSCDI